MKLEIKITKIETGFLRTNKEIATIDICNGHWKYNDNMMETDEKISLTLNTIGKAYYLSKPVKDAYPYYDHKLYKETGEIKVKEASVRLYDNLLDFLNCRINNVKDDYKKGTYKLLDYDKKGGMTFNCVLFEDDIMLSESTVVNDITFKKDGLLEINIKVVE